MLDKASLTALLVSIVMGIAIAFQATWLARSGKVIGHIPTGMLASIFSGVIGACLFVVVLRTSSNIGMAQIREVALLAAGVGLAGIFITSGVSFAVGRGGAAVGLAGIFLGQMLMGFLLDTFGWAGAETIPFSWSRVAGLLLLFVATMLLLPQKSPG